MKKKKKLWILLLIVGLIPLLIPLIAGIVDSINGFAGLCFIACEKYYGFSAFRDSIILYSYICWPTYIIGLALIVLSVIKLRKKDK